MATETINERMPIADVRDDLDAVIDHAQETKQPIVVTRDGKAAVVIIDFAQYQKVMDERDIFRAVLEGRMLVKSASIRLKRSRQSLTLCCPNRGWQRSR